MSSNEWVYFAIAKSVIDNEIFSCVFPESLWAKPGDRVSCLDKNGEVKVGDVIYGDGSYVGRDILTELVEPLGAHRVMTYWKRTNLVWEDKTATGEEAAD